MKYRPHRGGLKESMEEMVEVNSLEELTTILNKDTKPGVVIKPSQITIEKYGWGSDDRIGWKEVYSVSVRWYNPSIAHVNNGEPTLAVKNIHGFSDSNIFNK